MQDCGIFSFVIPVCIRAFTLIKWILSNNMTPFKAVSSKFSRRRRHRCVVTESYQASQANPKKCHLFLEQQPRKTLLSVPESCHRDRFPLLLGNGKVCYDCFEDSQGFPLLHDFVEKHHCVFLKDIQRCKREMPWVFFVLFSFFACIAACCFALFF